jgi:hypothetical protein
MPGGNPVSGNGAGKSNLFVTVFGDSGTLSQWKIYSSDSLTDADTLSIYISHNGGWDYAPTSLKVVKNTFGYFSQDVTHSIAILPHDICCIVISSGSTTNAFGNFGSCIEFDPK